MRQTIGAGVLVLLGWLVSGASGETPVGWRNDGTGHFPTAKPPTEWSSDKNVVWKVALPGASYGAPIIVGDRLFVVSDPAELLCISRKDGKILWKKSNSDIKGSAAGKGGGRFGGGPGGRGGRGGPGGRGGMGGMGGRGATNSAATPVSDGKHVASVYGNGVVTVYTLEGKRLWGKAIDASRLGFGHAASPLLLDGKVIVHIKNLVALDVETGKEAWRVELSASHASPIGAKLGKEDVVISPAGAIVRAHDGKILAKGGFRASQASPVLAGDTLCLNGRASLEAFKVSTEGGEIKVSSLWSGATASDRHQLPSSLVHDSLLYSVNTSGILDAFEAKTGTKVYRQRLPLSQVYSSVTLAGNLLYVMDTRGKAVVFKPGRKYERVAVNQLEGTGSCPVFAGEHLYLRGGKNLYCLAATQGKPETKQETPPATKEKK